ncbi:MAG TPA: DUF1571 domain-containing protein [Phycisphaerae bacterium]|nr:DUF1571 domain-containing protein [Phycisphaerae bacterium]
MVNLAEKISNRSRLAAVGLLITLALCVQCHREHTAGRTDLLQGPVRVERVYAAGAFTEVTDAQEELAKSDPLAFLDRCREHYRRNYRDYRCTFIKQERIGSRITPEQVTNVKFRDDPYSVNMHWLRNADQAEQVTYIAGRWPDESGQDQAWCKPAGAIAKLFISKILQPVHGKRAEKASRRTIDQFGFASTLELIIKYSERSDDDGALDLRYIGRGSIDDRPTYVFERRLPYTGQEQPYPDALLVFHIDTEWLLPTACFSYADVAGEDLLGKYVLTDVTFNVGFTDTDFGPETLGS